jgi:hypothetical protein
MMHAPSAAANVSARSTQVRSFLRRLIGVSIESTRRKAPPESARGRPCDDGHRVDSEFRIELERRLIGQ